MAEESQGNCNKCPVYVIWESVREVRYLQLTGKLEDLLRTPNAQLYSPSVQTLPYMKAPVHQCPPSVEI